MAISEIRPTLLVGVGGTGCDIAQRVFRLAQSRNGDLGARVSVIGFDTDANDMARLQLIDPRDRFQISSTDTVYQILKKNPEIYGETGFALEPDALPDSILNMRLTDGAAQIRMLTHMALFTEFGRGRIQLQLGDTLSRLGRIDSRTEFAGEVNVIIAGSFAGATGSGSFLQLALLLGRLASQRSISASVRGLFLLPDVFVRAASLPTGQITNVLANGYAAMKELAGVVARAERQPAADDFVYEFAPGSQLENGEIPFKSITFIDFENTRGGSLGRSLESYKVMAARAIYQQIFTPIGGTLASVSVNDAIQRLASAGRDTNNMYSGIGISAVVYPAIDVAEYLILRLARETLSEDWLRLDQIYRRHVETHERQRAAGDLTHKLRDFGEMYLDGIQQLAEERVVFFGDIWNSLHVTTDNVAEPGDPLPLGRVYVDALMDQVLQTFWRDTDLAKIRSERPMDSSMLKSVARLEQDVRTAERSLDDAFQSIDRVLAYRPEDTLNNILATEETLGDNDLRAYHIRNYIVRGAPHPVLARAFLYQARDAIQDRLDKLDVAAVRKRVLQASRIFSSSRSGGAEEESQIRSNPEILKKARELTKSSLMNWVRNRRSEFVSVYIDYYNSNLNEIRRYANDVTVHKSLTAMARHIDMLLQSFSSLFNGASESLTALDDRLAKESNRHSDGQGAFAGDVYVFADARCKEEAWRTISASRIGLEQLDSANKTLIDAVYNAYREFFRRRTEIDIRVLRSLFEESIVHGHSRNAVLKEYRSSWDFSIVEAAKREAELMSRLAIGAAGEADPTARETTMDWKSKLRERVDLVANQAQVFLAVSDQSDGQKIVFWTVAPQVRDEFEDDAAFDEMFTFSQGERPDIRAEYSRYELVCINNLVNLELAHFSKLNPGIGADLNINAPARGSYYGAYVERIDKLLHEELAVRKAGGARRFSGTITPHINRDWHKGIMLPEIFPENRKRRQNDICRAILIALGLGLLRREKAYDRTTFVFNSVGFPPVLDGISEKILDDDDLWQTLQVFGRRAHLVMTTLNIWKEHLRSLDGDARSDDSQTVEQVAGTSAVLNVLEIGAPRTKIKERENLVRDLFTARILLLMEMSNARLTHLDMPGRIDFVSKFDSDTALSGFESFPAHHVDVREETLKGLWDVYQQGRAIGEAAMGATG